MLEKTLKLLNLENSDPTFREFSNERTRVERRENFRKLRLKENFYRAIDGYFEWISEAGRLRKQKTCYLKSPNTSYYSSLLSSY